MTQDQAGQVECLMKMWVDDKWKIVWSTEAVADNLKLKHSYVTKLCDMGKLIATKVNGRWWVHDQMYRGRWVDGLPF